MPEFTLNTRSPYLRGLILHDERIKTANLDTSASYTEAGASAGQPTPTVAGFMDLEASGTIPAGGYDLEVVAQVEGGPVGGNAGGRYRWRKAADGATDWRGSLAVNKVTGFEWIRHVSSGVGFTNPDALHTPDHKVIAVYTDALTSAVAASILDPDTDLWTDVTITSEGGFHPAIVRLPANNAGGGRLLCLYVRDDLIESGTTYLTIGSSYSDDDGATWTEGTEHSAGFKIAAAGLTVLRLRCVYHAGYLTLIANVDGLPTASDVRIYHLVSADQGTSWEQIETIDNSSIKDAQPAVNAAGTVFIVHENWGGAIGQLAYSPKATTYSTFASDPRYNTSLNSPFDVDTTPTATDVVCPIAITIDDAGALMIAGGPLQSSNGGPQQVAIGEWSAETWLVEADDRLKSSIGRYAWPIDLGAHAVTDPYFEQITIVPYKGRILLIGRIVTPASLTDQSLGCVHLGGYSSIDWKRQTFGWSSGFTTGLSLGNAWFPAEEPGNLSTWTASGTGVDNLVATGLQVDTTADTRIYERDGSTSGNPVIVWGRLKVTAGGTLASSHVAINARRANGTVHFEVVVRARLNGATQELRFYDVNAGAPIGLDATGLPATALDIMIGMGGTTAAAYYKNPTSSKWVLLARTSSLTDGGGGTADNRAKWGHLDAGTATSIWHMLLSSIDTEGAATSIGNYTNPDDLQGRAFSTEPLWVADHAMIRSRGGSAYKGDAWTAKARFSYGVQHLDPMISPSPSTGWKAQNRTEAEITWFLSGGLESRLLSTSIGCALLAPNFRTAILEYWDGGAWQTLISFDGAETIGGGAALTYQIAGDHILPAAATPAGSRFIEGGELVGGFVELDYLDALAVSRVTVAKIEQNTSGVWRDPGAARAAEFIVDTADLGLITTAQTCRFIPPILVGVRHNVTVNYAKLRLRIPANQVTYGSEGYQLGGIILGPLAVFGMQNSWGRVSAMDQGTEITETPSGSRTVRRLGPPRRRVDLSWSDGWPTQDIYTATPDPTYIVARAGAGYDGIGVRQDPTLIRSLLRRQDGASLPVIYVPKIDQATGGAMAFQYSSPALAMYGRITSGVTSTEILGNEAQDTMQTIDSIQISEEV